MKKISSLLITAVILLTGCTKVTDSIIFEQVDPLQKIIREASYFPGFDRVLDYAAGESATFQFVLRSTLPLSDLNISVTGMENAVVGFEGYVFQAHKTPDRASDALIPPSGFFPDPIFPTNTLAKTVGPEQSQPMWVTVEIPKDEAAGLHKGTFTVKGKCAGRPFSFTKEIAYNVFPVVLDEPDLWVANWFSLDPGHFCGINGGEPFDPDSDEYFDAVRKLAKKLRYCHSNAILLPMSLIGVSIDGDKYTFDYTRFDRIAGIFREEGVLKMLQGGHIGHREGLWDSQFVMSVPVSENGKTVYRGFAVDTPQARNYYSQFFPSFANHLKEAGLAEHYTQFIADEPTEDNYASYIAIAKYVKSLVPGIKLCDACHSNKLDGILDIWVPQLNFFEENYEFYRERQAKGDQVWFYTCLAPQGESLNRFLEQPLLKTRLLHWLNFRFGATGYLHWGFNYWKAEDPFNRTTGMNTESGNTLPGGDSHIIYPVEGNLIGSIRLEAMRDGIADYTLLQMLSRKCPDEARELCRQMIYNWNTYDLSTSHFYDTRTRILTMLSSEK